jgi:hypothetical protein
MSHFSPEVYLHIQTLQLPKIAGTLKQAADVCAQFTPKDDAKSACVFSDIVNCLEDQIASLDHIISAFNTAFWAANSQHANIHSSYETLTEISAQIADFSRLMDCAAENNKQNTSGFAAYFSMRLGWFSMRLDSASSIITDMEALTAAGSSVVPTPTVETGKA